MPGQTQVLATLGMLSPRRSQFRKIRLGSLGDGGYVLPDDLAGISHVLSIGVGGEVSFDLAMANRGVPIYQYDPTVDGPPVHHEHFHFFKTAWSHLDGDNSITLAGMLKRHDLDDCNDVLLKFDTEGAEWKSLAGTPADVLKRFRIIACELHGLNNLNNLAFLQETRLVLDLLTRSHEVVHLHANNCCGFSLIEGVPVPAVLELTLLRKDRSTFSPCDDPIPGPLDYPNMNDRPDLVLRSFV